MSDFWEDKFQKIGLLWSFEPADSAIFARDLFVEKGFKSILIPGVGYGRNAKTFIDNGFEVTGIEISETAIRLARDNGLDFRIYHGPVKRMPYGKSLYDGIFCYALLHLLNQNDRRQFLKKCFDQLQPGGMMVFIVASKENKLYGNGRPVSIDRFLIDKGLTVFFYDSATIEKEFSTYGLLEYCEIDEPVKHMPNEEPMKFWRVVCRKS
ncbi:methyltransferase [Aquipluma nitroreducens]|uniref:Methyltransferase n=1 Tax=Aquipluma nitroreducens TaxID=2010828 RepID=A0A5K7S6Y1_9BACT|nr:class I SAM-dependent methyltransferase [Aquipluma nitroreducens]BBE17084.1 methyltransferase [Aquipluma nitroreducens]